MQNAIITQEQAAIEDVKRLANIVLSLRNEVFKKDLDYGVIPGTGNKPTLLLPGMEKLMRALHLRPEYVEKSKIEDFDKPLIYYRYECRLIDYETGLCISTAVGSANSHESKWRWRASERLCPTCGKPTIIKGKEEYGGGWICFAKKGGCGAKFKENDPAIAGQQVGRIENPDIFDQMNTIDKIAQKRALGSAIKGAANVSEFFTVDLEDFTQYATSNVVEATWMEVEPETERPNGAGSASSTPSSPPSAGASGSAPAGGNGAKAEFFPDDAVVLPLNTEGDGEHLPRDVNGLPVLGSLDMKTLGKLAQDEGLVKGRNHFSNLIDLLWREGSIRAASKQSAVMEAIRKHYAEKDLAKEGVGAR